MVVSAIAPNGHLRFVSRHGELLDKRPDDQMTDASSLAISLWTAALLCTFIGVLCIIVLAGEIRF
ncbi:unnamed protein product [Rodentolepis nana]|uniref:Transmembrane protein n=1 Tax=Rodentolepis nana TaxID=102285 RepID=A0A0R3T4L5_RODNA|nr:unnamed protein product [Rodentolepis nana]